MQNWSMEALNILPQIICLACYCTAIGFMAPTFFPLLCTLARKNFFFFSGEKTWYTRETLTCQASWPTGHSCYLTKVGVKEELMGTPGMKGLYVLGFPTISRSPPDDFNNPQHMCSNPLMLYNMCNQIKDLSRFGDLLFVMGKGQPDDIIYIPNMSCCQGWWC